MAHRKRRPAPSAVEPAAELLRPSVCAYVDPAAYESEEAARDAAYVAWTLALDAHNRSPHAVQTPVMLDFRYARPAELPWQ